MQVPAARLQTGTRTWVSRGLGSVLLPRAEDGEALCLSAFVSLRAVAVLCGTTFTQSCNPWEPSARSARPCAGAWEAAGNRPGSRPRSPGLIQQVATRMAVYCDVAPGADTLKSRRRQGRVPSAASGGQPSLPLPAPGGSWRPWI